MAAVQASNQGGSRAIDTPEIFKNTFSCQVQQQVAIILPLRK